MSVVSLQEASDEATFGGKGAALACALRAALPVPRGVALSWSAVAAIARGDEDVLRDAIDGSRGVGYPLSVRSSAIGEDSAAASFAGQHTTILNVVDDAQLREAILAVYASAASASARAYRERVGVSGEPRIAVVLQKMVRAESAGVLFTRNPLSGAEERVIEAAWGLGEAVVAGIVTPDRYRLTAAGDIIERTAGIKDVEVAFSGSGTVEREVDPDRARILCLSDAQLGALHELAAQCQSAFGRDIDLEFAFEGETLYLLQSRPITSAAQHAPDKAEQIEPAAERVEQASSITPRRLIGFALAAILSPLNSTMIAVALPAIGTSFAASGATLTLCLVSAYLLVSIIAQSPSGKLSDIFGYSPVLTSGRVIFAAGALLGALAPSVTVLTIARVAMAIGGALNVPPVMAELRNQVAPERRGRLFGFFGAIMGSAAAIGPLLGDLLIRKFGWHSVFLVNLPIIALSLLFEPPRSARRRSESRIELDHAGIALFTVAICLLVGGLQARALWGWVSAAAGVLALVAFTQHERRTREPLLDPSLFAIRSFTVGSSIVALQNFAMYAVLFLVPFLLKARHSTRGAGAFLLAMTGAMVVASMAGGRASDAFGARSVATMGAVAAAGGTVLLILVGTSGTAVMMLVALALLGCGVGLGTSPSQAAALSAVPPRSAGTAAGAVSTMRYIGGVLGSAVVALIVSTSASTPLLWIFPLALLLSGVLALLLTDHRIAPG